MNEKELLKTLSELEGFLDFLKEKERFSNKGNQYSDNSKETVKNLSQEDIEQLDELFEIAEIMADEDMIQILGKIKKIIFGEEEEK